MQSNHLRLPQETSTLPTTLHSLKETPDPLLIINLNTTFTLVTQTGTLISIVLLVCGMPLLVIDINLSTVTN